MGTQQLTDVTGIGPATAAGLAERGLRTVEDLKNASIEEIRRIPGFGVARAAAVRQAAARLLASPPEPDEKSLKKAAKGRGKSAGGKKDKSKAGKDKKKSKKKVTKKDKEKKKKGGKKGKKGKGKKKGKK